MKEELKHCRPRTTSGGKTAFYMNPIDFMRSSSKVIEDEIL